MKKNKIMTALMAVALFGSTGAALVQQPANVQAARVAKSKKSVKYGIVNIKVNAPAYRVAFNKSAIKVAKVSRYKQKGKKAYMRAGKQIALFYFNYKGTKYYYLNVGGLVVKAKNTTKVGKRRIPSYAKSTVYSEVQAKIAQDNKINSWNSKLTAAQPKTYSAKISTPTYYYVIGSDNKVQRSDNQLPIGTAVTVAFKTSLTATFNGQSSDIPFYVVAGTDGKTWLIETSNVTLDDSSAQVPDQTAYQNNQKNYSDLVNQARKDLGIKTNN